MILLLQFFLAHIIGDFFLQWDNWIKDKEAKKIESKYLWIHAGIHFALLVLITGNFLFWKSNDLPWLQCALITVLHFVIDLVKLSFQKEKSRRRWFLIDQVLHVISILAVWSFTKDMVIDWNIFTERNTLIYITAILFVWKPASVIIRNVISKWEPEQPPNQIIGSTNTTVTAPPANTAQPDTETSLENAGQLIGMIERTLILCFILLGKWEGVGFLLAAKSVFRFGDLKDAKDTKLTEYVLIGTLLSFGIAVVTGILTIHLLDS